MRRKFNLIDIFESFVAGLISGLAIVYVICKFV